MENSSYSAPRIEKIGSFRKMTNGLWFGKYRDLFGGKAAFQVTIKF